MRNDNNCVLLLFLGKISKQLNKRSKGLNKSSATGAEGGSIKLTMKRVEPVIDMDINIYIYGRYDITWLGLWRVEMVHLSEPHWEFCPPAGRRRTPCNKDLEGDRKGSKSHWLDSFRKFQHYKARS